MYALQALLALQGWHLDQRCDLQLLILPAAEAHLRATLNHLEAWQRRHQECLLLLSLLLPRTPAMLHALQQELRLCRLLAPQHCSQSRPRVVLWTAHHPSLLCKPQLCQLLLLVPAPRCHLPRSGQLAPAAPLAAPSLPLRLLCVSPW